MTMSEQTTQALNELCEKFGIVIDWTNANVIPYLTTLCAKLVSWEIWTSVVWMAIMAVASLIVIIVAKKYRFFSSSFVNEWELISIILIVASICLWVGTISVIGTQIFDIIKCVTFPEMYVFEYVQGIVNGGA